MMIVIAISVENKMHLRYLIGEFPFDIYSESLMRQITVNSIEELEFEIDNYADKVQADAWAVDVLDKVDVDYTELP